MAAGLTSCYDLDTQPMSSVVTEEQRSEIIESDPSKIDALASGIYGNYNGWELATGEMYDFGVPGIMVQLESRTQDMVTYNPGLYGWFANCVAYTDNTATSGYNICRWRIPYNTIYTCNQLISTVTEVDPELSDPTMRFYMGQALGNRAYSYWSLAQIYQFNIVGHEQAPCVPIITEKNQDAVATEGAPRASVQAVYDQILADLNQAIELMTGNPAAVRDDKRYIDIDVLYGLRARTYLCMQEYDKAAADAQKVISSGHFAPISADEASAPGFSLLTSQNWIWGINMDEEDVHGLYTFTGMMGSWTYGYAYAGMWKLINAPLWSKLNQRQYDVRKLWWIAPSTRLSAAVNYGATLDGMNAAEYLESVGAPDYAVVKFAPYQNVLQQDNNAADVPLMRIEEMYLILAEAQGLGSAGVAQGKQTLVDFVNNYRWSGKTAFNLNSIASTEDFLEEVWFQRRVELWGEGLNYYDVMRLNKPVNRTEPGTIWGTTSARNTTSYVYNIPAEAPLFLSQIPTSEIENNPALTEQNPTDSPNNYR